MNYQLKENSIILSEEDKPYILKVKDLPEANRPREKLIKLGSEVLTTAELLSIILNNGTKKEGISQMAARILKDYGEKTMAEQTNPTVLEKELGIPLVKACQIVASFELGRRFFKKDYNSQVIIRNAKQAFNYLQDMKNLTKEQFRGLYLNSRYRLVHDEVISIGSLTTNIIHPREVFKPALEHSAVAIIIAHNHPSGNLKPTVADLETTKKLIEAGKIIGIDLLDHLIIARDKYTSLISLI